MEPSTITLPAVDHERDIRPDVVIVPDYNGDPIVHVFVTGERVLRMAPAEDWAYELTYPASTEEVQAHTALTYHLGGITEEQHERLTQVCGEPNELATFDDVMSEPTDEGHSLVAWVGTVAQAVYEHLQRRHDAHWLSEPTGW